MTILLLHEDFIKIHIRKDTLEQLEKSSNTRRKLFDIITVGVNVVSVESYQKVASWLLTVPEEKLRKITIDDVLAGAGHYIDESGYLA